MPTIEVSTDIAASPMAVTDALLDIELAPRWTSGLERLELVEGQVGEAAPALTRHRVARKVRRGREELRGAQAEDVLHVVQALASASELGGGTHGALGEGHPARCLVRDLDALPVKRTAVSVQQTPAEITDPTLGPDVLAGHLHQVVVIIER